MQSAADVCQALVSAAAMPDPYAVGMVAARPHFPPSPPMPQRLPFLPMPALPLQFPPLLSLTISTLLVVAAAATAAATATSAESDSCGRSGDVRGACCVAD